MTAALLNTRLFAPAWRHLRHADWPLAPLILVALLTAVRLLGAQSYAYWNAWLTHFTALLGGYCLVACARHVVQSVCFDRSAACWTALLATILVCVPLMLGFEISLSRVGVPTKSNPLYFDIAALAVALLVIPAEVQAERARLAGRAAERQAVRDREQAMARALLEARLAALQGQIEPHFIYNTLANVRALVRQDADAAERMLQHLIGFLRSAMPDLRGHGTPLGQELDRVEAYLGIIKMRMGERLRFSIAASDEARACQVPPLSVMTLVENAIQHGIGPKVDGGTLHVRAVCTEGRLRIDVEDDGAGFQSETGGGVGLVNLQERLATLFGDAAALSLAPRGGGGLAATIALPARRGALA
jgi:sensor histidine kinase YesM